MLSFTYTIALTVWLEAMLPLLCRHAVRQTARVLVGQASPTKSTAEQKEQTRVSQQLNAHRGGAASVTQAPPHAPLRLMDGGIDLPLPLCWPLWVDARHRLSRSTANNWA
jgi:hypothetical protein